jgi:hypothetical protein
MVTAPALLSARENDICPEPTFTVVRESKSGLRRTSAVADVAATKEYHRRFENAPTARASARIPPGN